MIGTGLLFVFSGVPNIASNDIGRNTAEIITVLLIALAVFIVINSVGLAVFCSVIQNKINQTSPNPPAHKPA